MELIRQSFLGVFLIILALLATACEKKYVLPEPDYRPETTTEACFKGTITQVAEGKMTVSGTNSYGKKESLEIRIESDTLIFTVYGGYVFHDQLKKGIKLKVWFKGEGCNKPFQPITGARIMIASEKPGDDWP
jgi:hypothetical protein